MFSFRLMKGYHDGRILSVTFSQICTGPVEKQTMDSTGKLCYNKQNEGGMTMQALLQKLSRDHRLTTGEYTSLIASGTSGLRQSADRVQR